MANEVRSRMAQAAERNAFQALEARRRQEQELDLVLRRIARRAEEEVAGDEGAGAGASGGNQTRQPRLPG